MRTSQKDSHVTWPDQILRRWHGWGRGVCRAQSASPSSWDVLSAWALSIPDSCGSSGLTATALAPPELAHGHLKPPPASDTGLSPGCAGKMTRQIKVPDLQLLPISLWCKYSPFGQFQATSVIDVTERGVGKGRTEFSPAHSNRNSTHCPPPHGPPRQQPATGEGLSHVGAGPFFVTEAPSALYGVW